MQIESDHTLVSARQIASPNRDARPAGERISLIVIHAISLPPGHFGTKYIEELFTNSIDVSAHPSFELLEGVRVSSHLLVDRSGQVTQFVPFNLRAWHAGESSYGGTSNCNDFSIGIELEGTEDDPFTDSQYDSLVDILKSLISKYPDIALGNIVGHNEIAGDRKWDPGPQFDWIRLMRSLTE
ncbi:MAG: 1,6-anhydro-N-acetylmuramyl-L-alanine amidase AmpD [Gammaproteobacteria bacterium]|nr:1,6-anhydro-N-acetylmuramyl-L-alanine amidase AmpD [Gammaproteobacteria bacterium]